LTSKVEKSIKKKTTGTKSAAKQEPEEGKPVRKRRTVKKAKSTEEQEKKLPENEEKD